MLTSFCWTNENILLFLDPCLSSHTKKSPEREACREQGVRIVALQLRVSWLYRVEFPFAELSCPQKASKMYLQRWWASFSHSYFITHKTQRSCTHTHTQTYIFSSPFYYHRFRVPQKHYLLHLAAISPITRHSFTYCQWPAPYKILAKHARSPLRYWESPCSRNPSWFVGTASYLACIA